MNINNYKNIDDIISNKDVYLASELGKTELSLIDKGFVPTKFGMGVNDVMEFALYDAANNVLEQQDYGTIRYIRGTDINKYLIKSQNIGDVKNEGGGWLVDIKKLIKEAGYNTGYFRVQLNFVNDRVGSSYGKNKLWIQQVSPTRTELRLLPYNNFDETNSLEADIKNDLNQSYDSFTLGKFSGDEVYEEIYTLLDKLSASDIANTLTTLFSQEYINELQKEFGIRGDISTFYILILKDMREAVINELLYRDSKIGSNTFGQSLSPVLRDKISQKNFNYYTKNEILDLLNAKFRESVEYHLPNRTLNESITLDVDTRNSIDNLTRVVQTLQSDITYGLPSIQTEVIVPTPPPPTPTPNTIITVETNDATPSSIPSSILMFDTTPRVVNITKTTATIKWYTKIESTTRIVFLNTQVCPDEGCDIKNNVFVNAHEVKVNGLAPGTTYSYYVESVDTNNNIIKSDNLIFTTLFTSPIVPSNLNPATIDVKKDNTDNTGVVKN